MHNREQSTNNDASTQILKPRVNQRKFGILTHLIVYNIMVLEHIADFCHIRLLFEIKCHLAKVQNGVVPQNGDLSL